MKKVLFLVIFIFCCSQVWTQSPKADSLRMLLAPNQEIDTNYVNLLNDLAFELILTDQKQSLIYIQEALNIAKKLNYERGVIRATTLKGNSFLVIGLPEQALVYYKEALDLGAAKHTMDFIGINNNIGEVYRKKEAYDSSIKYYKKSLEIAKRIKNQQPMIIYSNLGEVYLMQGNLEEANNYFSLCLKSALQLRDHRSIGYGYHGLAECAYKNDEVVRAIDLMKLAIASRKRAKHQRGLIQSYLRLGAYYQTNKMPDSALYYWQDAEGIARNFHALDLLNDSYNYLYSYYLKEENLKMASNYLERHKHLGDSIRNAEFLLSANNAKAAFKAELISAENELLIQKQKQKDSENRAQFIVLTLAFFIILGLGVATYQSRKRKKAIEEASMETSFTETLLALSKELNSTELNFEHFIEKLLSLSRKVMDCDRASYWALNKKKHSIFLHSIEERDGSPDIPPVEFTKDQFPSFFSEFLQNRTLAISKISQDPRLADIHQRYFGPAKIESMLNAPVLMDGNFIGFVSFTMTDNQVRHWTVQEQRFVGSLADLILTAIAKDHKNALQQENEKLIKKLQIRNKSLQEFNSVISHNLREPLTQIIGFSQLLKDSPNEKVSDEILDKIHSASHRIDRVVQELSTVLNERDPKAADFRIIALDKKIEGVLDQLKNELRTHDVEVVKKLSVVKLKSYKPFLHDILFHLILNSIKFSNPSKKLVIEIASYEDDEYVYLKISDNGRGMDLDRFSEKIFKMYQRYHTDIEGRGIGLFIVSNRVSALNGVISVESQEGKGTIFTLKFPKNR